MRPTTQSSCPSTVSGIGYRACSGSSTTRRPGKRPKSSRARSTVTCSSVSTLTATEWAVKTGTRTVVGEMRMSGASRIFRTSFTSFHSSPVYPPARSDRCAGSR